jgi:hypothetical protein
MNTSSISGSRAQHKNARGVDNLAQIRGGLSRFQGGADSALRAAERLHEGHEAHCSLNSRPSSLRSSFVPDVVLGLFESPSLLTRRRKWRAAR